ncbi:tRNA intron endonuclease [Amylocystis lapponica]|nr:tRNA intron endonuclease [Amylocystis lapponica]
MESHPSHETLAPLLAKYPRAAGALFQTYNDLKLAQQWTDLEVFDLTVCSRGALRGKRPKTVSMIDTAESTFGTTITFQEGALYVVPCSLQESLSISWCASLDIRCSHRREYPFRLQNAFEELNKPPQVYLAINSEDSSIVYYKISPGIVKPPI